VCSTSCSAFVTNLALVIPGIPLMIILAAYLSSKSVWTIVLVVAFTSWATGARVIRSQASTLRSRGVHHLRGVLRRAAVPGHLPRDPPEHDLAGRRQLLRSGHRGGDGGGEPGVPRARRPNAVSWGTILHYAQQQNALLTGQWVLVFAPGLAIALLALSFTLVNFGVDALSNPRLREK